MTDERLKLIKTAVAELKAEYAPVKISRMKISNYKFFHGDFELDFNGGNVLIYGENGSGKSSILLELERRGEYIIREAAEDVIKRQQSKGIEESY